MKKKILFIIIFTISLIFIPKVNAKEYIILNENKYFRVKPGGSFVSGIADGILYSGTKVDLISKDNASGYGCKNNWYKVEYTGKTGYICSSNQSITSIADVDPSGSFEKEMLNKGFTSSYLPYLKALHEKHPNWIFTAVKTGLNFNDAVSNENIGTINVVDGSDESLRSKDYPYYQNGKFIETNEKGWYVASRSTVSYYLDPRNFLTEEYIYMFENLKYNSSIQKEAVVKSVTSGSFLDTDEYLNILMKTARTYNVSPIYLASRIRQEKGNSNSISTTGGSFIYEVDQDCLNNLGYNNDKTSWNALNACGSGKSYSGIYNYFNIGAYSTYKSAAIRGLIWANGGYDASVTTYKRPWTSSELAIMGGTEYIVAKFINANQHTLYYQKFNVSPDSTYKTYTNQYMTNVRAHATEAYKVYKSYSDNKLLDNSYEFLIPVYEEMPNDNDIIEKDEDNITPPEEVEEIGLDEGIIGAGFKLNGDIIYGIDFNTDNKLIANTLSSINANLKITNFYDKYGVAANGNVGTGDKLVISNKSTNKTYTVLIYGDGNGDGKVTVVDLLRCQKYLLGNNNLTDYETMALDVNRDGKITVLDLLRIQKQILNEITIEQR